MTAPKEPTYQELKEKLDELMMWFEGDNIDPDQAIAKFEEGMLLVKQLEKQLTEAENKVVKLKQKFGE